MTAWAIDLGTTNSAVARWDAAAQRPRLLELPNICRRPGGEDHLEAPRLIPSAVQLLTDRGMVDRLGDWPFFARRFFLGKLAVIGRPAIEMNEGSPKPSFIPSFKGHLLREALRPVARLDKKSYSARDVARIFTRELFAEVKEETGERIRDLVITTPVDSFEAYRAEVMRIVKRLGVKRTRFIDEPVAAAIGYGLNTAKDRLALVIDFGGGTLDLALVVLTAKDVDAGTCRVLAKEARPIGGNLVDKWLLSAFCDRLGQPMMLDEDDDAAFWNRLMLIEACRVKESVFFNERETFYLIRPDELGNFEARVRGTENHVEITKEDVVEILEEKGLYRMLEECIESIFDQLPDKSISEGDIDDVLMVGGSTLLPNIYPMFEKRFGRDKVRAWQPFEAVAYGACAFAAESYTQSDFIVHDYAFVTYNAKTHEKEYTTVVPRGTRFPTSPGFWKRQLVPTCSLGEPETMFKLVICEIGSDTSDERRFQWDAQGGLHKLGGNKSDGKSTALIVPLNESNPTLGYLKPAHPPSDRRPRLEIEFGVNEDRWLSATVSDLRTKKTLMKDEPVVRLL